MWLSRQRLCAAKEYVHVLQRTGLGLGVQKVDDGNAHEVDSHEEEVDAGPDTVDTDGPDLGYRDRPNRATRGGKVETSCTNGSREDLQERRLI